MAWFRPLRAGLVVGTGFLAGTAVGPTQAWAQTTPPGSSAPPGSSTPPGSSAPPSASFADPSDKASEGSAPQEAPTPSEDTPPQQGAEPVEGSAPSDDVSPGTVPASPDAQSGPDWQEAPPESPEDGRDDPLRGPATSQAVAERLAAWNAEYERGKQLLRLGRFSEAATVFERLSGSAPHAASAEAARELAALANYWTTHGKQLVTVSSEPEPEAPLASGRRRRSTGEIASLYINSVVYGLGTGTWLAVLSEPESPGAFFLPTLMVTGASVGLVALADRGKGLHYGVPQSISSGMYVGFSQGLLWSLAHNAQANYRDEWSPQTVATLAWAGATAGAITGGVVGQRSGTTPGRAAWVGSGALWGGLLGGFTVGGTVREDAHMDEKALFGAALMSSAGTALGMATAGSVSPSLARVRFLDLGGLLGGLVGLGLYATAADDDLEPRPTLWSVNLGVASGLAAAWVFTSKMEPDRGGEPDSEDATTASPLTALLRARPTVLPSPGGGQLGLTGFW